jgi:putative FmdB family regulatory protein
MPIYEFECREHGVFELTRSVAEAREDAPCLACGIAARRILSLPSFSKMPRAIVKAHDVNERSRHEPRVVTRARGASMAGD